MYNIFVLFFDMIHITVIYDAGTWQKKHFRWNHSLHAYSFSILSTIGYNSGEGIDELFFWGEHSAVEEEELHYPGIFMVNLDT